MDRVELKNEIDSSFDRKAYALYKAQGIMLTHNVALFVEKVVKCFEAGGKLIVFGNGGSSSDASHFCAEFTGRFKEDRKPYPAICLNDSSFLTAVGNDYGFEHIFERGVAAFGRVGDLVVAISTSGSSTNVVLGAACAEALGFDLVTLTGKPDRTLNNFGLNLCANLEDTDSIQELHMTVLHTVVEMVEKELK